MTTPGHVPEEEWMACGVCARVLAKKDEYIRGEFVGTHWEHEQIDIDRGVDHPPVPVPYSQLAEIKMVCDFCSEPDPTWELPVEDFIVPRFYQNGDDWGSTSDWMACEECAAFLHKGLWPQLTRRAIAYYMLNSGGQVPIELVESDIKTKYALVRKHTKGALRPVRRAVPGGQVAEGQHRHQAIEKKEEQ